MERRCALFRKDGGFSRPDTLPVDIDGDWRPAAPPSELAPGPTSRVDASDTTGW
jgi:hypothetical protein